MCCHACSYGNQRWSLFELCSWWESMWNLPWCLIAIEALIAMQAIVIRSVLKYKSKLSLLKATLSRWMGQSKWPKASGRDRDSTLEFIARWNQWERMQLAGEIWRNLPCTILGYGWMQWACLVSRKVYELPGKWMVVGYDGKISVAQVWAEFIHGKCDREAFEPRDWVIAFEFHCGVTRWAPLQIRTSTEPMLMPVSLASKWTSASAMGLKGPEVSKNVSCSKAESWPLVFTKQGSERICKLCKVWNKLS